MLLLLINKVLTTLIQPFGPIYGYYITTVTFFLKLFVGSQRLRHDWVTFTFTFSFMGVKSESKVNLWYFTKAGVKLEKAMAPHPSTLAWKIPWTEEPGRLQSMGSLRVGHNWATSLWLFTFMHWRRKWQPTPVFLPGESQGWGSLVGCRLWGRTESDMTEAT